MAKVKTIITTDVEVDDMNSLIHLCLYLNEIDLLGVVYTASQYHFIGDGVHELKEITPHYRCSGPAGLKRPRVFFGPDPAAGHLKEFRPFERGWIEKLWNNEYREAYPFLVQHDSAYPSPEKLIGLTKYGNIEFEGDVRFDTEGSNWIKHILLEDSDDIIYIQSWGGANTIVRALLSIYEEYKNSKHWERKRVKIVEKVRILGILSGVGQDNSWLDNHIPDVYPGIKLLSTEYYFGTYKFIDHVQMDCQPMFKSEWLLKNIHNHTSKLMDSYHLLADGKRVAGEPEIYQFGLKPVIDFGYADDPAVYSPFDFLGEGDSNTYIPLLDFGLKGLANRQQITLLGKITEESHSLSNQRKESSNPFLKSYMEDWAARARWCHLGYDQANHAPEIVIARNEIKALPGETVEIEAVVSDPDGNDCTTCWEIYDQFNQYKGSCTNLKVDEPHQLKTCFTIPEDAESKDFFSLILRVQDHAEYPMTRYGKVIIYCEDL